MNVPIQRLLIPLAYTLVVFLLTGLIVIWRRYRKLEQEKQVLEQIVKERTKEMEEKNHQLERQAARFFSNISHEFRTPLTLIMLPLEHMLENCQDKEQEEGLNLMLQNSQRLLTLINQLPNILVRFIQGEGEGETTSNFESNFIVFE